jgi:ferrous iron transport protein B
MAAVDRVLAEVLRVRERLDTPAWLQAVSSWSTHPVKGVPFIGLTLVMAWLIVGLLGAGLLVDLLQNSLFEGIINPALARVTEQLIPVPLLRDFLVGDFGLITMALTYAVAIVLPIVGAFFIFFGLLEDSGYMPRLAVMLNRIFRRMGLSGKAVLPMALGLGCDTMATLTARIMETRKQRLIVTLLLALGVPCSAQLGVILGLLGGVGPLALILWGVITIGVILFVGWLAARVIPGESADFILELPPLRMPQAGNLAVKTVARIEWYLKEAVPLFVAGTFILFVLDATGLLGGIERAAAPILQGLLGLPPESTGAFLIGFLRRDYGAAGLYDLHAAGQLDPVQTLVALVTMTLFMPCIAQFLIIIKEQGWKIAVGMVAFIVPFAIGVGALLNLLLRLTGAGWFS